MVHNVSEEHVDEVRLALESCDKNFVQARDLRDDTDIAQWVVGDALKELQQRGELELYDESRRRRLYRRP